MNQLKTIGLFGLIAVISVVGINAVSASNFGIADTPQAKTNEKTSFLGHVEAVVTDPKGNIIAYRQSDNVVTNVGHNCIAQMVFGVTFGTGSQPCLVTAATPKYIGLSNTVTSAATDQALTTEITTNGLSRVAGTVSAFQVANGATVSTIGQVSNTFTDSTASTTVQAAGLFDAATVGAANSNMFAENSFTSTTLAIGDQLTVTWKITLA